MSSIEASCEAAAGSPMPNHVRKMTVVKVSTPKYCTAPKSASVSIRTSATPAAMAGQAMGSAMRRKDSKGDAPSAFARVDDAGGLLDEGRPR